MALGVVLMVQLDQFTLTARGVQLVGELPAFGPLPEAVREAAGRPDLVRLGAAGLSVGSALAAWVEYTLLRRAVTRAVGPTSLAGGQLRPVLLAAVAGALAAGLARPLVTGLPPLLGGPVAVISLAAVYFAAASLFGVGEVRGVLVHLRRRILGSRGRRGR